jgi:hypothetical protein
MNSITKHLPLLALALLVSSTELRAEDFPFKVGDRITFSIKVFVDGSPPNMPSGFNVKGEEIHIEVKEIKGKWVYDGFNWFNSDLFYKVVIPSDHWIKKSK